MTGRWRGLLALVSLGSLLACQAPADRPASAALAVSQAPRPVPLPASACRLDAVQALLQQAEHPVAQRLAQAQQASGLPAAGWLTQLQQVAWQGATPAQPAHCLLEAVIGAHTGPPGHTRYGNQIRLRVPEAWNARLVFQGGGGNNGVVGDALGLQKDGRSALAQGFAVVAQDSGHVGRDPHFALDRQAFDDFAHDGVHKASVLAKALLAAVAGRGPERAYFVGCSNGGREALVSAQRHADFDGVVAGAPGLAVYDQWLGNLSALQAVAQVAGTAPGQPVHDTSAAYTDAQLRATAAHFMAKCDGLDGLVDGLVHRPEACTAEARDWQALACAEAGGRAAPGVCLRADQVRGLQRLHAGAVDSQGRTLWPGFYPGHIEPVMRPGYLGQPGSARPWGSFYDSVMRNFVFMGYGHQGWRGVQGPADALASYPDDSRAYVAGFNLDTEPARLAAGRLAFHGDNVDPSRPGPNFNAFSQRGGRMLLYTGTMDNGVQPAGITGFVQRLQAQHGRAAAQQMARLFLVPGMHHCRGGTATELFDPLGALVAWVEHGQAPERLLARAVPGGPLDPQHQGLSRPLCAWPRYARYDGHGDVRRAESFQCALP